MIIWNIQNQIAPAISILDLEFSKDNLTKQKAELIALTHGARLPSINQFASAINQSTETGRNFYNQNKDMRYWVSDKSIMLPEFCKLDITNGLIGVTKNEWENLPNTEKVLVKNGNGLISVKMCDIECSNQIMVVDANTSCSSRIYFVAILGKIGFIDISIQTLKKLIQR